MAAKEIKVAIIRKTNSLENDDRIRKEVSTLTSLFPNVKFKVLMMRDDNKEEESITSYGLPYKSIRLKSRERYPGGKHLIVKTWDFYSSIKKEISDYDVVWSSGDEPTATLLFIYGKKLVWDLRELPLFLLGNPIKKAILKHLFNRCEILLHANQYRIDYLAGQNLIKKPSKHVTIRNFPEFETFDTEYDSRYYEIKQWIGNRNCVYLQGLSGDGRAPFESMSAVLNTTELCAIILGRADDRSKQQIIEKYGEDEVKKRICFAGNFNVLKIPQYMKLCKVSMVFYKNTSPNNYYCEANRLYQAIDAGLPVLVGENPTMKKVVESLNVGISVDTDGSEIEKIKIGLDTLFENCQEYSFNISKLQNEIKWNSQNDVLNNTFNKLFT